MKRIYSILIAIVLLLSGCTNYQSDAQIGVSSTPIATPTQGTENGEELAELEVHFIDVGQGDSTLIVCDGETLLIDAGDNDKGTTVQLYLQKQGITELDYVIGTHTDADHIGGMDVVLYKFDCKTILMPDVTTDTRTYEDVINTIKTKYYKITYPVVGTEYELGDAKFTIIAPVNYNYGSNKNNYSIAILLEHGENRFLFAGDAEEEAEIDILDSGANIEADCYKVSHHGSSTSTSEKFLNAISPEYAVISCGKDNDYGHPHDEVMEALKNSGATIYRTDEQGSIVAVSDGKDIIWNLSPSYEGEAAGAGDTDVSENTGVQTEKTAEYVLNTSSKKFHYPTCSSVETISEKNREDYSGTRSELIEKGYSPCGRCEP